MIVNPVRYGGGKPKQVEVTYTTKSTGTNVFWVDASNELQETTGKEGTIYPIAGSIFVITSPAMRTITNASLVTSEYSIYAYRAAL